MIGSFDQVDGCSSSSSNHGSCDKVSSFLPLIAALIKERLCPVYERVRISRAVARKHSTAPADSALFSATSLPWTLGCRT